jgi:hypothetical protein
MTHIVSKLRDTPTVSPHWVLHNKAADEIERLRTALENAADALHDAHAYEAWASARQALGEENNDEND